MRGRGDSGNRQGESESKRQEKKKNIVKIILRKENEAGDIMLPDFKLLYKVIVIKIECYWPKNRHLDQ